MPDAAPVTTAVRPSSENAAAIAESSVTPACLAASSRSFEIRFISPSDLHGAGDAMAALLQRGHDDLGQQLEVAHHLLVRQITELHVAEQLVDAHRLVPQDLLQALLGRPDDDHVLVLVVLDWDLTLD